MFSLPEKYKKDSKIPAKPFLGELTAAEKKRFQANAEEIRILYQIEGYDIPSVVNDDYNCQAIAFLAVTLKDIKSASFIGRVIQKQTKILCVIRFCDGESECYCFADKRLNKQDENEIILENIYITDAVTLKFTSDTKTLFNLYIDYEMILNRDNKHAYYMEMMTKAFLVFNENLLKDSVRLLDSKLWYNEEKTMKCFGLLNALKQLRASSAKTAEIEERGKINKEIKEILNKLEELI